MSKVTSCNFRLVSVFMLILFFYSAPVYAQEDALPQDVKAWQQAAAKAVQQEDYGTAVEIYGQIIQAYPQTRYAIEAYRETAAAYIKAGQFEAAKACTETLKTEYSNHPDNAESLYWIARHYGWNNHWEKAMQLHRYNVAVNPSYEKAMWSQVEIIYDHIRRKDWAGAQAAQAEMLTRFSEQPTLSKEIWQISRAYVNAGRPDTAMELCSYLANQFPETEYGAIAQGEIIVNAIRNKDFSVAETEYKRLLTNFGKTPMLPREIYRIAGVYAQVGQTDKSFQLYRINSELSGDHDFGRWSGVEVILMLIRQKNFPAAQEHLQAFVSRYADEPTLSKELYIFAREFDKNGYRDIGFQIHRYNAEQHANTDHGRWSGVETVFYYIDSGDQEQATTACLDFFRRYAAHPDLPKEIKNILTRYIDNNYLPAAKSMCETAMKQLSDNPAMIWVQHGLVLVCLDQQAMQNAYDTFEGMLINYENNEDLPQAIMSIGQYCRSMFNDTGLAIELYNRYLKIHGKQPGALDVAMELVGMYISMGAEDTAASRIPQLLGQHADNTALADMFIRLGHEYRKHNYQAAINLFKAGLALTSNDDQQLSAYTGISQCYARLGKYEKVREIVNLLLFEHGDNRDINHSMFVIGEEYYFIAEEASAEEVQLIEKSYLNAVSLWQKHLQELPHNNNGMFAYYTGVALSRIGHDEDAMAYFQQVVERWPDFSKAWDAQLLVAQYIGRKSREGIISEKEAEEKMKNAYENIIRLYPGSPAVPIAQRWLTRHKNSNR